MTSLSRLNIYGISILFFTSILSNCVKEVEQRSLLERNGLRYEANSDKPFSGKAVNGDSETTYKDGKKHGHDIWISDGIKRYDISYINGKLNGPKYEWYETGQKKTEAFYQEDLLLGKFTTWFENGQLELEVNFKAGVKDGISKSWRKNGHREYEKKYLNGELHGVSKSWNTNDQLEVESEYKNGNEHGTIKSWHSNGQQKNETMFKNGKKNGLKRTWDNYGQLETQTFYKDGKEVEVQEESLYDINGNGVSWILIENASQPFTGKAISTYRYGRTSSNGQLQSEVLYIDGKKNGLKRTWYEDGQLQLEETYVDNELDGLQKKWNENGQLESEITFKNGKKNGLKRTWQDNGSLLLEETYVDNKLDGLQKKWYRNGQLESEITFRDEKISGIPKGWFRDGEQKTDYDPIIEEADAALGTIRTQLRIYYGENGEYPYSRERTYVMGARWNDIWSGELTGRYFSDNDYIYQCYNGYEYTITCLDKNGVLGGDRCLDQSGNLFNRDHIAHNMDQTTADVHNMDQTTADVHKIIIKEVIQANSYTYLRALERDKEYWIATAKQPFEVGMTLHYDQGLEMKDFTSKEIGRTFGSIWFVRHLRGTSSAAAKKVAGDG
jgi:antitoxin component YwqK of YwqJK toxin-antitoxin module